MRMTRACLQGKVRTINVLLGHSSEPAYATEGAVVLYGAYAEDLSAPTLRKPPQEAEGNPP